MEAAGDIIDFLPVDIICCILLWLPVSSLLRFKSVSKSWLSLIESSDFVNKHMYLNNACGAKQQQDPLIILTCPYPFSSDKPQQMSLFSFDLLLHNKQQQQQRQEVEVELDFPVIDHYYQANPVQVVASWNGIICLRQHRTVCLWNPATKRCTNLPPLPVVSPQGSVGFGFDPNARDYKVVAINLACDGYVFHIYSLSSCSWRKCEGLDLHDMISLSGIKTPYRGSIYCWLALNLNNQAVYMFDFSDEVFTSIPSPSSSIFVHDIFTITERIACGGKLRNEENTTYYEIWMLRDYRVGESWTKLYLVDLAPASETIQWMTQVSNNGDLLLFLTGKQLCLYDLVTQQVTNLPVDTSDGYEVVMYRESMLSVKRGNGAANGLTSMDCNRRMLINQSLIGNSDWADSNVHRAVMFRILLWLPVLSLQRFKSACKLWCSLIKSSDFVTQHLVLHHHQHKQDNFSLILHSSYIFDHPFVEDSSHHSPNTSRTCLLSADKLELLDLPTFDSLYITTSFNGIICLARESNKYGDVCLWNPATKQFRNLCPERNFNDGAYFHFGFGFDIKTNSYKLVSFCSGNDSFVQVYCFSTNSWRIIYDEILPTIWSTSSVLDAPYKDEIYCWLMHIDYSRAILSFDFSNEVFGTIPLPDSINKSSLTLKLTILKDKIGCISLGEKYYSDDTENWHCEVWMMNEYGDTESWFRLYMVGPFSKDWCFKMCYSKKVGDYILLLKDGQLYEYNLVTQDKERLSCQIQGPKDFQVVAYKASLLPIK